MHNHVPVARASGVKSLAAHVAHERPLVSVNPLVQFRVVPRQEAFVAKRARVRSVVAVRLLVFGQGAFQFEPFVADGAGKVTFAGVNALVELEVPV